MAVKVSISEIQILNNENNNIERNIYDEKMKDYLKNENNFEDIINFNSNFDERANIVSVINNNNKNRFNEDFTNKYSKKNSFNCYHRKLFSIFGGKSKGTIKFFKKFMQTLIEKQKIKIFPELIEDILDYDLVDEMNNLYFIKFPNKTPIIYLMNNLLNTLNYYRRKNSDKNLFFLSNNFSKRNSLSNHQNNRNKSNNSTNISNMSPSRKIKSIIEEDSNNKNKNLNNIILTENIATNNDNYQKNELENKKP